MQENESITASFWWRSVKDETNVFLIYSCHVCVSMLRVFTSIEKLNFCAKIRNEKVNKTVTTRKSRQIQPIKFKSIKSQISNQNVSILAVSCIILISVRNLCCFIIIALVLNRIYKDKICTKNCCAQCKYYKCMK